MAHPKSSLKVELEGSKALPGSIAEYGSVSEFLSSCTSKFTAKGYKTALSKFFNFAAVEKPGFTPDVAIKQKSEELNPLVLKIRHAVETIRQHN